MVFISFCDFENMLCFYEYSIVVSISEHNIVKIYIYVCVPYLLIYIYISIF